MAWGVGAGCERREEGALDLPVCIPIPRVHLQVSAFLSLEIGQPASARP